MYIKPLDKVLAYSPNNNRIYKRVVNTVVQNAKEITYYLDSSWEVKSWQVVPEEYGSQKLKDIIIEREKSIYLSKINIIQNLCAE